MVLLFWAVLAVGIHYGAPRWDDVTHDGDFAYLPDVMTSVEGQKRMEEAWGADSLSKSSVVLVVARSGGPLELHDYAVADRLVIEFTPAEESPGEILSVLSHRTEVVGQKLVSVPDENGQALLILVRLKSEFMAIDNMDLVAGVYQKLNEIRDELRANENFHEGLQLGVTGSAAIGYDMLAAAGQSIDRTEIATVVLVIAILLLVYRSPGLVLVPLVTIGVSVVVAMSLVALVTQFSSDSGWFDFKIFKTTKIFVVVILFGAGTDYCLFLISRYKEELQSGLEPDRAISLALANVGDALAASALTTILGLGAMVFCDFGKYHNSGPAIALCLIVALLASVTLAPALLRASGRAVFWPFGVRCSKSIGDPNSGDHQDFVDGSSLFRGFWEWLSRAIIARPGLILLVSILALSPLAWQGFSVDVTYDLVSELPADSPSVRGTRLLRQYFPAGETSPVTVLVFNDQVDFESEQGLWEVIQPLAEDLYELEYTDTEGNLVRPITSVRSIIAPLGGKPEKFGIFQGVEKGVLRRLSRSIYMAQEPEHAGRVTRLDLVFSYDPFSEESIRLLAHVEDHLYETAHRPDCKWQGTSFEFVGTTAGIRDLRLVTTSDLILIKQIVPLAVLAVLVLILRRPLVSAYLILSVMLGFFVTIGIAEMFFQWLYGDTFHGLDWKVPMFLFVILIAVGQDYNIYLTTRVFEEQRLRGRTEGLRVALVRTGGIITSCGVIMAGTFASMTTGTLRAMQELGFALALGVILDTFVIRTIMVPAFLMIWDKYRSAPPEDQADPHLS